MNKCLIAAVGLLLALGSGAGIASAEVSAADVQQMISDQLTPKLGATPDSVVCPNALATEAGASVTCDVNVGGVAHAVMVTVAEVDPAGGISVSIAPVR